MYRIVTLLIISAILNVSAFADGGIRGTVKSKDSGYPLSGASVAITNTKMGGLSDSKGNFEIKDIPAGKYTLKVTYVGYNPENVSVTVRDKQVAVVEINLTEFYIESDAISVVASRAEFRETPVAFSNIS